MIPFLAIIVALFTASLWPLVVGAALFVALLSYEVRRFYRLPMVPTVHPAVAEARRWERVGLVFLCVIVAGIILAYWASRAV